MQCPIAGFQFHGGGDCWARMQPGDALELRREPGNRHDARAISVEWNRVMLGYVPKEANYALSQVLDRGGRVAARIAKLRDRSDPWQRVMMEISLEAPSEPIPASPRSTHEGIILVPGQRFGGVPLTLAPFPHPHIPDQLGLFETLLLELGRDVARRLGEPLRGIRKPNQREVILWGSVAIRIGAKGRDWAASYLDAPTPLFPPFLTHDLRRPIGDRFWASCVVRGVEERCARHGLERSPGVEDICRWMLDSMKVTFTAHVPFEALRQAALQFLAPDPLARSLTNRVFGNGATAARFNWVAKRNIPIALCAVEQPAMLPFLRLVHGHEKLMQGPDPLMVFHDSLVAQDLDAAAWKSFPLWTVATFEALPRPWREPGAIAGLANLLHRLQVKAPPPREFIDLALEAEAHRCDPCHDIPFGRHPLWFMRALLQATERAVAAGSLAELQAQLITALDWLIDADPELDTQQQNAGWPWILVKVRAYHHERGLAMLAPWRVPFKQMAWAPCYQIVAIASAAELHAEGVAMKNCLPDYEDACRAGSMIVFSIRHNVTGDRFACFAADRDPLTDAWKLYQVAGKKNASVSNVLVGIARRVAVKLNLHPPGT